MSLPANKYCSIARTLGVLGQKWNLLLLREAFLGRTRYADFQRIGVPHATLGQRLDSLVEAGLLQRRPYKEDGERGRDEYVLTEAGRDALPILAALSQWGDAHLPLDEGPAVVYRSTGTGKEVHLAFVDASGATVDRDEVSIQRGRGHVARLADT